MPLSDRNYFLTGASGFVGKSVFSFLGEDNVQIWKRNESFQLDGAVSVIHLAGMAHDLKNTSSSQEYYEVNTELTKKVFDAFLESDAKVFIGLSSVKAAADEVKGELTEHYPPNPITHYGKSKLLAEQYIFSREIPEGKRIYILRPCMIHGAGNKGNLNLLYKLVSKNIPWPLGAFENKRSFCSIDNLLFIMNELIEGEDILSGIYNVADDEPISTNELIGLIAQSQNRKPIIWNISKKLIAGVASLGDKLYLPLNTERLQKLTSSYVVSNAKIKAAIGKPLPISSREGLLKTFKSFNNS
ncbi:NAD-dependent epimerase/dehydratase family protein [Candidatus Dependentiae bacterium]|nr:NAD-dependent epimerase/dehydratase family protein [Candidatus Dependentiae bacterium]